MKIKITPTRIYIAVLCLIALAAWAANPAFTDFIASQFDTSGNVVKIKSGVVLTNVSEWGPMTASDSITASNGFFSLGTAAGELVLGQGSGTGGIFDYSGATKSNEVVVVNAAGRFVSIPGTVFTNGSPAVWSNYQGFIFPAGEPAPDTTGTLPGPSVFFRNDGSLFQGTNLMKGLAPSTTVVYQPGALSMVTSNEPSNLIAIWDVMDDSDDLLFESFAKLGVTGDKDFGITTLGLSTSLTNGLFDSFSLIVDPGITISVFGTSMGLRTNGQLIFNVEHHGVVTANGFTDSSGTPGSLVAYQGGNRLGATNVAFVTVLDTTYITNQLAYITNLYATYITNNLAYVTNLNVSYVTNNTAYITNLFVNNVTNSLSYITNLFVNNITNHVAYITNLNVFTTVNNFASNYIAGVDTMATNANNTTPDFAVMGSTLSTNNNFKWLPPIHLDTTGKAEQWIITHITNSLGTLITMTAPDNVHVCGGGAMNVTNWTEIRWQYYPPSGPTNCWPSPGY